MPKARSCGPSEVQSEGMPLLPNRGFVRRTCEFSKNVLRATAPERLRHDPIDSLLEPVEQAVGALLRDAFSSTALASFASVGSSIAASRAATLLPCFWASAASDVPGSAARSSARSCPGTGGGREQRRFPSFALSPGRLQRLPSAIRSSSGAARSASIRPACSAASTLAVSRSLTLASSSATDTPCFSAIFATSASQRAPFSSCGLACERGPAADQHATAPAAAAASFRFLFISRSPFPSSCAHQKRSDALAHASSRLVRRI